LHPVFNINLLKHYIHPEELEHPSWEALSLLAEDNPLNIKKILDVRKVGRRFEYLLEQSDKPSSETSWFMLNDIPDTYNELLETFHCRHTKLP
ncbi:uncharacterized protein EI90DRAFT_2825793, partial [Cantharellus anzutake]|uniref:uncharacterized protein n=1 Tax=Cantharellus anzutake TaxID=1750568 RepID=UPI0019045DF4